MIDPEDLRQAMRNWATGVTIVSARYGEIQHGMTVSSFTSVSLSPPFLLISLEQVTKTHHLVSSSGYFGISLLAAHQKEISDRFAGRHNELSNRFEGIQIFHMVSGTPLISDSLSVFDCKTISSIPSGTHTIFIGEVLAARQLNHGLPLIYFDRDYREIKT
jgi:flavin reductase (DIM6/NTAB) family NADH-FMN oxidoreductase RutF